MVRMLKQWFNKPGFVALRRHAIFPSLVFILASMVTGEFYPFSPYSMFSNPDPRPLKYYYLSDGEDTPLPTLWHTGVSPASITKKFNKHRSELEDDGMERPESNVEAGTEVLDWLRELSMRRRRRELIQAIRLVEVRIEKGEDGKLVENSSLMAELSATELPDKSNP